MPRIFCIPSDKALLGNRRRLERVWPRLLAVVGWLGLLGAANLGKAAQITRLKTYLLPPDNQAPILAREDNAPQVYKAIGIGKLIEAQEFKDLVPAQSDPLPTTPDPDRMSGISTQGALLTRLILFFNEVAAQPGVSKTDRQQFYDEVISICEQFFDWREEVRVPTNGPLSPGVISKIQEFTFANLAYWGQATDFRRGSTAVCNLFEEHAEEEFGKLAWQGFHNALLLKGKTSDPAWPARMRSDLSDPEKRPWWEKFVKVQNDLTRRQTATFSEKESRDLAAITAALTAVPASTPNPP